MSCLFILRGGCGSPHMTLPIPTQCTIPNTGMFNWAMSLMIERNKIHKKKIIP